MKEWALLFGMDLGRGGEEVVWKAEVCKSHELEFYRLD